MTGLRDIIERTRSGHLRSAEMSDATIIDSYDFLQFLIAHSEKLGVEVPEKDYAKFTTLDAMVQYLTGRVH